MHLLISLMVYLRSLIIYFFTYFFKFLFLRLKKYWPIFVFTSSSFYQVCCRTPPMNFFQLFFLLTPEFLFEQFVNSSLFFFAFYIWWDVIFTLAISLLDVISFSLNIFKLPDFRTLSNKQHFYFVMESFFWLLYHFFLCMSHLLLFLFVSYNCFHWNLDI